MLLLTACKFIVQLACFTLKHSLCNAKQLLEPKNNEASEDTKAPSSSGACTHMVSCL